jgi:hypothetical protein
MGIHDQLCLQRHPRLAVWGALLFGFFGISEGFSLHHLFATTIVSRLGYLAVTVCFMYLVAKARCAIERVILTVLSTISAVALCASILGAGTFLEAKLIIMGGWFIAAAACGFWALYSRRQAKR